VVWAYDVVKSEEYYCSGRTLCSAEIGFFSFRWVLFMSLGEGGGHVARRSGLDTL